VKSRQPAQAKKKRPLVATGRYGAENPVTTDEDLPSHREKVMSLGDHLEELRRRIIAIIIILVVCGVAAGIYSEEIHVMLVTPYKKITGLDLMYGSAYSTLDAMIQISLLTGALASLPICLFILWGFITPALSRKTAWIGNGLVASSSLLFWLGMILTWIYIVPISMQFMFLSLRWPDTQPLLTLEQYYSFLFMLLLAGGLVFQIPLLIVVLGGTGIVPFSFHKKIWKFAIVGIVIFSGIATPPDPLSQIFMAVPLTVLYGGAVGIVWMLEKSRRKSREMEEESEFS